ncbi:hypothetical protein DYB28_009605 [Aphanomyces astaci]|uniref:DDE-1 domain-containing protein n=1 Tax=Aphanomyces astaci TaxID=112090 RepID=A0A397FKM2_APHAT|nr:hypothetical protein DYB25_009678 [Aphanomyces astaci]RHY46525.1 hypothetical protein DYB34_010569 [Aphanomyces astaci]RHY73097.1 hypothetical protein DYB30_014233 [Aphanomyces astaci]RHY76794.1 hypothetical protein DYB38_014178 [Aphanomyces astaci]RHZ31467.1 hypothetical protein DYB31_013790 [Aphanomyces astaci]
MKRHRVTYLGTTHHGGWATFQGKGRGEFQTISSDLVDFMESVRDGEHFLTTAHLVTWVKSYQPQWLSAYMTDKSNDSARKTMPLLIIIKGTPGGEIDVDELPTYPPGPVYAMQKTACMDQRVWSLYLREVLQPEVDCPSVVLADKFTCNVLKKSYNILEDELFCSAYLQPLPANTTSVLQPLDMGVMGRFKQICHRKWITEVKVVTAAEKRLSMIQRTIKVWEDMKEDTVR